MSNLCDIYINMFLKSLKSGDLIIKVLFLDCRIDYFKI